MKCPKKGPRVAAAVCRGGGGSEGEGGDGGGRGEGAPQGDRTGEGE